MAFASKCSLRVPFLDATTDKQHQQNYVEIQRWADRLLRPDEGCLGDGKIPFLVAASDASDESRAASNYLCDGTADEEEIEAAITDIAASSHGAGTVLLSEGTFTLSSAVDASAGVTTTISFMGGGAEGTTTIEGTTVRGGFHALDFGGTGATTFFGINIQGIHFSKFDHAINCGGRLTDFMLRDCVFTSCDRGLSTLNLNQSHIHGNSVYSGNYGFYVSNTANLSTFSDNSFFDSLIYDFYISTPTGKVTVSNNASEDSQGFLHVFGLVNSLLVQGNAVICDSTSPHPPTIHVDGNGNNIELVVLTGNQLRNGLASPGVVHIESTGSSSGYPLLTGNHVYGAVYLESPTEMTGNSVVNGVYVADAAATSFVSNNVLGDSTLWGSAPTYTLNEQTGGNADPGAGNYLDGTWT